MSLVVWSFLQLTIMWLLVRTHDIVPKANMASTLNKNQASQERARKWHLPLRHYYSLCNMSSKCHWMSSHGICLEPNLFVWPRLDWAWGNTSDWNHSREKILYQDKLWPLLTTNGCVQNCGLKSGQTPFRESSRKHWNNLRWIILVVRSTAENGTALA